MKINFKSPFLWIGAVFLLVCVAYISGGHIVAGIVCGFICAGFVALSLLIKSKAPAVSVPAPVQVSEVPSFAGTAGNVGNVKWDLSRKIIMKNDKEWFDVNDYHPSASGFYALCDGCDSAGNDAVALISKSEGLKIRRVDAGITDAFVSDSGVGYAIMDDNSLLVIDSSSASFKKLADESADRSARLLCPLCCIVAGADGDDKVHIDGYDFASQKVWHKSFSAEYTGDDIVLSLSGDVISVSSEGITKRYQTNGDPV